MQDSLVILLLNLAAITLLISIGRKKQSTPLNWVVIVFTFIGVVQSILLISSLLSLTASLVFIWVLASNARLITKRREHQITGSVVAEGWFVFVLLYFILFAFDYVLVDAAFVSFLSIISLGVASLTLLFTIYHAFRYRMGEVPGIEENILPAVTLAVPARNETHAIKETLARAVASEYAKLEILVIDDCSQDRTSQIIRDFAHDGIRFIEGVAPSEHWLGKNSSYKALAQEASGEYIIFSGVDVRLSQQSIDKLVAFTIRNELEMVSVMPQRLSFDYLANFFQTTRYFFQFILPWELLPVNPVLSSLWIIKRETLLELGSFDSTPNLVVPERFFANATGRSGKYRFIVSDNTVGVTSRKRTSSQIETATRTLYPLFRNNPMLIFLASAGLLVVLVLPFLVALLSLLGTNVANYHYGLTTSTLLVATNLVVYTRFNASTWFIGLVNFPFIIILEAGLLQWSMFKYEYSKVIWKDRNICIPVLNPPLKRQRQNPLQTTQ